MCWYFQIKLRCCVAYITRRIGESNDDDVEQNKMKKKKKTKPTKEKKSTLSSSWTERNERKAKEKSAREFWARVKYDYHFLVSLFYTI